MASLPAAVIGEAVADSLAPRTLERLTAIGSRAGGQAGEAEGAAVVEAAFEAAGLREVGVTDFDVPGWWRGPAELAVDGAYTRAFDLDNQVIALPGSPAGEVEGPLVDLGYGLPEDFEGRDLDGAIVVSASLVPEGYGRWVHRNEKYSRAVEAGAAGFCYHNHVPGCLPVTGYVGFGAAGPGAIPATGLSYEVGYRLERMADDGATARLRVDSRSEPSSSQNVEAVIGPETDEEVLVTAHHDCHDIAEGAGDNAAGSALVVEVGRLLALCEDRLGSRVRLLTFGAEEPGMYGSDHWAATHDLDRVRCVVNIDGVGGDRTPIVNSTAFPAAGEPFDEAAAELSIPIDTEAEVRPHGDHWSFSRRGVPALGVGSGGHGRFPYAHTHADTLDKVDTRDLRDLAVAIATGVLKLAEADREIDHLPPAEVGASMADGYETGLRAEGRWPFD